MKKLRFKYKQKWEEHRISVTKLSLKDPKVLLATWFGCGTIFPGPGFWGTLGAMPLGISLLIFGGPIWLLGTSLILFIVGLYVSRHTENILGTHDSSIIVIDEAAAVLIPLAFIPITPIGVLSAFILFRIFDVVKPWPISFLDKKVPGEWGVMIDDTIAALYAAVILYLWPTQGFSYFIY